MQFKNNNNGKEENEKIQKYQLPKLGPWIPVCECILLRVVG